MSTEEPVDDTRLWADLATMWEDGDPVPADLADRVLVALAMDDVDAEYEVLHLVERSTELAGTRGADAPVTVTFASDDVTVMVHVSTTPGDRRRVDGWVAGPPVATLTVLDSTGGRTTVPVEEGRFAVDDVPSGPTRLVLGFVEPGRTFATPVVQL
jgi:hypothetical protein